MAQEHGERLEALVKLELEVVEYEITQRRRGSSERESHVTKTNNWQISESRQFHNLQIRNFQKQVNGQ